MNFGVTLLNLGDVEVLIQLAPVVLLKKLLDGPESNVALLH